MENYELSVAYQTLLSFIESQFSEEVYKKISNRFTQLEEELLEKNYEGISQYGFSSNFSVRQVDIKTMLENASYDFNTSIAMRKSEIENIFESLYMGLSKTLTEDFDEDERRRYLGAYIEYAKENISSLYIKINDSFEFFDELDKYFKYHSESDEFCDEMHSFLTIEKEKFSNDYIEAVKDIIKTCKNKTNDDIENYVLPHLNKKEQEKEKEKDINAPVTTRLKDGTISSQYIGIDISMFKYDSQLLSAVKNLGSSIIFMDLLRDKKSSEYLKERYIETITACKTSEDFKNLDEFLEKLARIGGIANKFYSGVSQEIKTKITIYTEKEEKKQRIENEAPVTRQIQDGTITSPYLNVDISKFKNNSEMLGAITGLIHALVYMDLFRDEKRSEILKEKYSEALGLCIKGTSEDFKNLDELLSQLANIGGYAIHYYSTKWQFLKTEIEIYTEKEKQKQEATVEEREATVDNAVNVQESTNESQSAEEKKEERNAKSDYRDAVRQFLKETQSIINKEINFFVVQELFDKLDQTCFMKEVRIESQKMLDAIGKMYHMHSPTIEDDSNLLIDNFSSYIESCMNKNYAGTIFIDFINAVKKDIDLDWDKEDSLYILTTEYEKNFNSYMNSQIQEFYKETLKSANKHYGIVYPENNQETLEEEKGHKI